MTHVLSMDDSEKNDLVFTELAKLMLQAVWGKIISSFLDMLNFK